MDVNIEELKSLKHEAQKGLSRKITELAEREQLMADYLRVLDETDGLIAHVEEMNDTLEDREQQIDRLNELLQEKQQEIDCLRLELVEAKEQRLMKEQKKNDAAVTPTEIHNHFGAGSNAQVFNDKVTGKVKVQRKWRKIIKKNI